MSDFENRLTDMLTERAAGAPGAEGLAGGARTRQRQRRTTRVALAAGAAIVAIVAVPVGLSGLSLDDDGGPPVAGPSGPEPGTVPAGWRWESYHELEFAVPDTWVYGPLSQYCISSNSNPVVERPGGVSTQVACPLPYGYGVLVSAEGQAPTVTAADVPAGAGFGQVTEAGVTLTVIAKSQDVVDGVLGSAAAYPGADFYGCEAEVEVPALGAMADAAGNGTGPVSVCRYEVGVQGANLVASEVLKGDLANQALLSLESLEPGAGPNPGAGSCLPSDETQAVLLRSPAGDLAWIHYDGCTSHGVDVGGELFQLNAQVMWAALGPNWSAGLGGEIPMPREPRFVG